MKQFLLLFLRAYKLFVSPALTRFFGGGCRFSPTCGDYAYEAIEKHGAIKGSFMGAKRVLKCHPGSKVTFDPVK